MDRTYKDGDREVDIRIWKQVGDDSIMTLYTVTIGKRALCISLPIEQAMDYIREELED